MKIFKDFNATLIFFILCARLNLAGYQSVYSNTSLQHINRPFCHYSFVTDKVTVLSKDIFDSIVFSVSPFYITSIKEPEFSPALLPGRKNELVIATDDKVVVGGLNLLQDRDIRGEYMDLESFKGTLGVLPSVKIKGFNASLVIPFEKIISSSLLKGWSLEIQTTFSDITHKNKMKITSVDNDLRQEKKVGDFFESQSYATLYDGKRSQMGLENVEIFFNGVYISKELHTALSYFGGLAVPMQNGQLNNYLFDTTLGNNGHWGLIAGGAIRINLIDSSKGLFGIFMSGKNTFFIHREAHRTFDLKQKPWSRFLKARNKITNEIKPISEITNLPVKLHPCNSFDLSAGFILQPYELCKIRVGYNIWGISKEYISLKDHRYSECYRNILNWGIAGEADLKSASLNTINIKAPDDVNFKNITIEDLDRDSAGSSSGYSQTIFFDIHIDKESASGNIGAFVEWGKKGYNISKSGFWLSLILSF
jgi:hypothetical protein